MICGLLIKFSNPWERCRAGLPLRLAKRRNATQGTLLPWEASSPQLTPAAPSVPPSLPLAFPKFCCLASVQEMGRPFVESGLCPDNTGCPLGSLPLSELNRPSFRSDLWAATRSPELILERLPAMEGAALFCHPLWFICSLALLVLLWIRRRKSWSPDACPVDLSGKTAIVTGASSGIGKAVALDLARKNARTILACRCREKGQAAVEEIRRATGNPHVQLRLLDVSSMASVRDFARRFLEEGSQLHILVNNAGVTGLPFAVTTEGLELTFATNVSGAFLLTNLLLGTMVASAPARIVNVSSFRHFCVRKVDLKWLTGEELPKNASQAYDCTKLMNVLFTTELARRLQGTGVSANVLSPGIVRTEILRHYGRASRLLYWLCSPFMMNPQRGATSTLYCAVAPEVEGISGKYFDSNCTLVLPQTLAHEPGLGQRLWDALEKATGLKADGSQQAFPVQRER